ncbi:hypothetical protein Mapa_004365 [Marchantia paleacea]|nr:hypothetical protein Mapa_004365 [Marchantia paleacea]
MFGTKEAEAEAKKITVKTFVPGEVAPSVESPQPEEAPRTGPTPEQMVAIKAAIANSQTLEEVARLEKALRTGQLPADLILTGDEDLGKPKTDGPVLESTAEEPEKVESMDED